LNRQVAVIDRARTLVGESFSFSILNNGYTSVLLQKLVNILPNYNRDTIDFAIEILCNRWLALVSYLHGEGYYVLSVSPATDYHSSSMIVHDFS